MKKALEREEEAGDYCNSWFYTVRHDEKNIVRGGTVQFGDSETKIFHYRGIEADLEELIFKIEDGHEIRG